MTWLGMAVASIWSAVLIWAVFHVEAAERESCDIEKSESVKRAVQVERERWITPKDSWNPVAFMSPLDGARHSARDRGPYKGGQVKRFAAFSYQQYYPAGGWCDFTGSYDTVEEARVTDPTQIVDLTTGQVVYGEQP